jgi:hypothetical protein
MVSTCSTDYQPRIEHSGSSSHTSVAQASFICCLFAWLLGLFAGGALYISTVEVPAAAETGTDFHYAFFPHMFKR